MTLAVSGMLWQRSLVMIDSETKSLWSQLLGRAMDGPLKGKSLETIPSVMTDWKSWRRDHPNTSVLMMRRTAQSFVRNMYTNLAPFVIGIVEGGEPRAWPLDQLQKRPILNDRVGDAEIVLMFDPASVTTYAYRRQLGDQTLDFAAQGRLIVDKQTGSSWDGAKGRALTGPLQGKQLKPVATILSFRKPWSIFHPDSTYWQVR